MNTEQLIEALEFYQNLAELMRKATLQQDQQVLLHAMKQMSLDGGRKAKEAIAKDRGQP